MIEKSEFKNIVRIGKHVVIDSEGENTRILTYSSVNTFWIEIENIEVNCVVDQMSFMNSVSKLETVNIKEIKNGIIVYDEDKEFKLNKLLAYPKFHDLKVNFDKAIEVEEGFDIISKHLSSTILSDLNDNESRNGILISEDTICSTNRMGCTIVDNNYIKVKNSLVITKAAIRHIEEASKILIEGNFLNFKNGNFFGKLLCLENIFPNLRTTLDSIVYKNNFTIYGKTLAKEIENYKVLFNKDDIIEQSSMIFNIKENLLEISYKTDKGEFSRELDITCDVPLVFHLNPVLFLNLLKSFTGEIIIWYKDDKTPLKIIGDNVIKLFMGNVIQDGTEYRED